MRGTITSGHSIFLTTSLLACAATAHAQVARSLEVGLPFGPSGETTAIATQVGFRVASTTPHRLGLDFSIATTPLSLPLGAIVVASDLDITYPIPLGNGVVVTPRAGGSALGAVLLGGSDSDAGAAGTIGYNVGLGLVVQATSSTAIRVDYTQRRFNDQVEISSFTIGFVWTR
jgi:hypothetical protein